MAVPAYSTRFFAASPLAGLISTVGPVPDGLLWVVRDMALQNTKAAPVITSGLEIVGSADNTILLLAQANAFAGATINWQGRQVFEPGESIDIICPDYTSWTVAISGYALTIA